MRASATVDARRRRERSAGQTLAEFSLALNEPRTAADWFERATAAAPPSASLLGRLADARWRAGQREFARRALDQALEQDPASPALRSLASRLRE